MYPKNKKEELITYLQFVLLFLILFFIYKDIIVRVLGTCSTLRLHIGAEGHWKIKPAHQVALWDIQPFLNNGGCNQKVEFM